MSLAVKSKIVDEIDNILNLAGIEVEKQKELQFRRLLLSAIKAVGKTWDRESKTAVAKGLSILRRRAEDRISEDDFERLMGNFDKYLGKRFPNEVKKEISEKITKVYKLTKAAELKPFKIKSVFRLPDKRAVDWISNNNFLWIKDRYDVETSKRIGEVVRPLLEQGASRGIVSEALEEEIGPMLLKQKGYAEVLASAALNRSRNFGQLQAFEEAEIERVEFVNPMDEQTSEICREYNGQIFTLTDMTAQRDRALATDDLGAVKEIMKWPSLSDARAASRDFTDMRASASAGIANPPLHGRCRSRLVAVI